MASILVTITCDSLEEFQTLVTRVQNEDHGFIVVNVDADNLIVTVQGNVTI